GVNDHIDKGRREGGGPVGPPPLGFSRSACGSEIGVLAFPCDASERRVVSHVGPVRNHVTIRRDSDAAVVAEEGGGVWEVRIYAAREPQVASGRVRIHGADRARGEAERSGYVLGRQRVCVLVIVEVDRSIEEADAQPAELVVCAPRLELVTNLSIC